MRFEVKIRVPKGGIINIGKVGPWPIEAPKFMGGADQIILRYKHPAHIWIINIKDLSTGKYILMVNLVEYFQTPVNSKIY